MKNSSLQCLETLTWEQTAHLFRLIGQRMASGTVARAALTAALMKSDSKLLQSAARHVALPLSDEQSNLAKASGKRQGADAQGARLVLKACEEMLARTPITAGLSFWRESFDNLYRVHRWVEQQSAQSQLQLKFLISFVPVVSCILCIMNGERFFSNLMTLQGRLFFLGAAILYAIGVALGRRLIRVAFGLGVQQGFGSSRTQLKFLTDLLSEGCQHSTKSQRFAAVCRRHGTGIWQQDAAHLFIGIRKLGSEKNTQKPSAELSQESEFLSELRLTYVNSTQGNHRWLIGRQKRVFEDFQADCSRQAALLALRLLCPMALFFLPALFLILALTGFSLEHGALD
jgi:hypothetical protein